MLETGLPGERDEVREDDLRSDNLTTIVQMMVALLGLVVASTAGAQTLAPQRIVSLNLCLDPIVLALVPRARIAALSKVSADASVSAIAGEIAGIRLVRGGAEEVLALDPDLVLAGPYTTTATVALLTRLGRRVETVPMASDIDGVRDAIRQIAAAVGERAAGERLVADLDGRLMAMQPSTAERPGAIAYQVGGAVSPGRSLMDWAMTWVGLANRGRSADRSRTAQVPLEMLVADPPDLIVMGHRGDAYLTPAADNLRHPALKHVLARTASAVLPLALWICGTPALADAAAQLADARAGLLWRDGR